MRRPRTRLLVALLVATLVAGCSDDVDDPTSEGPGTAAEAGVLGALPVPRTEVAGATWTGRLVVAGGLTPDGEASDLVHVYDAKAGKWNEASSLPVPLHHAGMAVLGGRLYIAGGYTNGPGQPWVPQAAMRSLGRDDKEWRDEAPMPAGPRGALGLASTLTTMVAAGGETGGQALTRTEFYDAETRAWRPGPDLHRAREHHALTAKGERVYAIAGRTAADGNLVSVESIDPIQELAWSNQPDLHDARGGIGAAAVEGRVCVAGGEAPGGTIASVECLDGFAWVDAARLRRPRHGLAVIALDGRLHVVAGGEQPGLFVSDVHEAFDV
ncbi:MAG: Kelch repeat-containing protein [Acidimicrobiales bacterium]